MPIENGSIGGYIVDAQSRINVNNLSQSAPAAAPTRLVCSASAQRFRCRARCSMRSPTGSTRRHASTDPAAPRTRGISRNRAPGLAANAPARRVGELLLVRGVDPASIARLRALCHGPRCADRGQRQHRAGGSARRAGRRPRSARRRALSLPRDKDPFASIADFRARLPRPDLVIDETAIDVRSDWFEVSIEARQGDTLARARALLKRSPHGEWPVVVWQTVE